MEIEGLVHVASYRRTLKASLERVWENVLDWEHLPWLHRSSFASIECSESGDWGWRARIGLRSEGRDFSTELLIEREKLRYVARTLEGEGSGTEIWTLLEPQDDARTGIEVEFHVPGVPPERVERIGTAYRELYTRLWDEDEAMMIRRTTLLTRPAPSSGAERVRLGLREELMEKLPLVFEWGGRRFRLVQLDGELHVHAAVCPHMLGPLDAAELEDGCVRCPWHGYRFDVRTGLNADGRRLRLPPAPEVEETNGAVWLRPRG